MSESGSYPKAEVIRRSNFSESRICPTIYRMFRSVDWTHDMIIVKWREVTIFQFFRKPNLSEYLPNVPKCGLNTWHDNREVTLIHLSRAQTLRSDKCATGSIPTNGSMTSGITIHWALRMIFVKFFVYLMMTNFMVKKCLNQKIIKIRIWFRQWRIAYVR